jgi:CheY-like chemotaxis protein
MGKKVLVADDSITIQKVIRLALSTDEYDVLAVSDGNEAIKAIEQELPDVVLLDVSLPFFNAFQVKKEIDLKLKESAALIKFVLLTSAFENCEEEEFKKEGFVAKLTKPFDPSSLRQVLNQALNEVAGVVFDPSKLSISPAASEVIEEFPSVQTEMPIVEPIAEEDVNDIKDLTESTISLNSNDDDLGWSLQDSKHKKKSNESIRPVDLESDFEHTREILRGEKNLKTILDFSNRKADDGGATFPIQNAMKKQAPQMIQPPPFKKEEVSLENAKKSEPSGAFSAINENVLRKELEPMVEKLIRELVPVIAEKMLKKEIEKILSEN